jgi:hypothetical protein
VTDLQGNTHTMPSGIVATFVTHLSNKYKPIDVDEMSIETLQNYIRPVCQTTYAAILEQPITYEELIAAIRAGARRKSPGIDGLPLEFFSANWDTISSEVLQLLNHMFLQKHLSSRQKHGIVVCLPKSSNPHTPNDYRPISLLTTDYKLLARVLARHLSHILADQLHSSQFCGVPGNSILDAISCVRDVIAHAEATGTPLCVLTLDFEHAFDCISHRYLFHILRSYGISQWFVERIHALYDQATASVQINGFLAGCIPIQSGVRQGCPLSVVLFALCMHPLLRALENGLPKRRIGRHTQHSPVIAYADDVKVFVTRPEDFVTIQQAIRTYERATGARLNPNISKALAVGPWEGHPTSLGIAFHERANSLGVEFGHTIALSMQDSWARVTCSVRAQARKA